jgi:chromosome segregation ATPase
LDGEIIREAILSSDEADDVSTYAELLKQERDKAEYLANQYKGQAEALDDRLVTLKREIEGLNEESARKTDAFAEHAATFAAHLRNLQRELDDSMHATAQLRHERELLEQHEARLRIELDQARELADERYRQIQLIRQEAEEARARSESMIADLDRKNADFRSQIAFYQRELDNLRTTYDDAPGRAPEHTRVSNDTEQGGLTIWGARTLAGRLANNRSERRDR